MPSASQYSQHPRYYREHLTDAARVNAKLLAQYQAVKEHSSLRRSHFFAGRYENIYIERARIPALEAVLAAATEGARRFLKRSEIDLQVGFWFNDMGPGHITLPHKHDEDDELLSAVYYIQVPLASGDLLLGQAPDTVVLTPVEGDFIFFAADVLHEVTSNTSDQRRLSVAMNFGQAGS